MLVVIAAVEFYFRFLPWVFRENKGLSVSGACARRNKKIPRNSRVFRGSFAGNSLYFYIITGKGAFSPSMNNLLVIRRRFAKAPLFQKAAYFSFSSFAHYSFASSNKTINVTMNLHNVSVTWWFLNNYDLTLELYPEFSFGESLYCPIIASTWRNTATAWKQKTACQSHAFG